MPRPLAGCSETLKRFNEALQRFRIYALSYEALQHFIEALSNLTCRGSVGAGSDHLQLIKFWRSCATRKGSAAGRQLMAPPTTASAVFASL